MCVKVRRTSRAYFVSQIISRYSAFYRQKLLPKLPCSEAQLDTARVLMHVVAL